MARILIIDDEDELRSMLRRMFEQAGHQVTEALKGAMETGVPPQSPRKHKGKKQPKKNGQKRR